ncbi:hypothetical protein BT96DRAFT_945427 [Gymnopus androsaceus JB14]|uniref:Uncharacterized protein n=1 Tax=Gymnopus androsaceus JB14 TaxID=1447944 RepID=A0A6A4GZG6_9AGAR|nr:hypothetical protein BT96DRAFT_945427 [Gymnopus androsaceus JB14]
MLSLPPTSYGIDPNDWDKTYEVLCKVLADLRIDGRTYFKNLYKRTLDIDSEKQFCSADEERICNLLPSCTCREIGYCASCGAAYMKQQGTLVGSGGMSCPASGEEAAEKAQQIQRFGRVISTTGCVEGKYSLDGDICRRQPIIHMFPPVI